MYVGDHAECSLLSPNGNQTWISKQILVTQLILKFVKKY
jgi:hypothetical protein